MFCDCLNFLFVVKPSELLLSEQMAILGDKSSAIPLQVNRNLNCVITTCAVILRILAIQKIII